MMEHFRVLADDVAYKVLLIKSELKRNIWFDVRRRLPLKSAHKFACKPTEKCPPYKQLLCKSASFNLAPIVNPVDLCLRDSHDRHFKPILEFSDHVYTTDIAFLLPKSL
jgi:hypothetical protein